MLPKILKLDTVFSVENTDDSCLTFPTNIQYAGTVEMIFSQCVENLAFVLAAAEIMNGGDENITKKLSNRIVNRTKEIKMSLKERL